MKCYKCGSDIPDGSNFCTNCSTQTASAQQNPSQPPRPNYYQPIEDAPGVKFLLPLGRSGWAIAAGYLGLFSMILLPAPLAIICSIIAIYDLKRNPKKCGWGRAIFGLVMGVLGTIGLIAVVIAMGSAK